MKIYRCIFVGFGLSKIYKLIEKFSVHSRLSSCRIILYRWAKEMSEFWRFLFLLFFFWISSIRNSNGLFSGFPCFENNLLQRLNLKSSIDGSFSRHVGYLCTLPETATLLQSWPLFGAIVVNLFWNFDLSRSFLYKLSCSSLRTLTFFLRSWKMK